MVMPGHTVGVEVEPSFETKRKHQLREMALSAKKAGEDWGRRWYLSLALGNAAAIAAIASATLTLTANQPANGQLVLRWALIPAAWCFSVGLISGALLPYCWKRMVERIEEWVEVSIDELNERGVVTYPSDSEDDDTDSEELKELYEKHQEKWARYLSRCEFFGVGGFLTGLGWMLLCFSKWALS